MFLVNLSVEVSALLKAFLPVNSAAMSMTMLDISYTFALALSLSAAVLIAFSTDSLALP